MGKISEKKTYRVVFDGECPFCRSWAGRLHRWDRWRKLELINYHKVRNLNELHPELDRVKTNAKVHVIGPDGTLYGGFQAAQRLCLLLPPLYVLIPLAYVPGASYIGEHIYQFIAQRRKHSDVNPKDQ